MVFPAHDELGRSRLAWPDPLVLELIRTAYDPAAECNEAKEAARLHARFLRALIDGETDRAGPLRLELIACCAARRIGPEAMAAADHAVFRELIAIVQARFRNSPQLQRRFVERLHDALGALTTRRAPTPRPVPGRSGRFERLFHRPAQTMALSD